MSSWNSFNFGFFSCSSTGRARTNAVRQKKGVSKIFRKSFPSTSSRTKSVLPGWSVEIYCIFYIVLMKMSRSHSSLSHFHSEIGRITPLRPDRQVWRKKALKLYPSQSLSSALTLPKRRGGDSLNVKMQPALQVVVVEGERIDFPTTLFNEKFFTRHQKTAYLMEGCRPEEKWCSFKRMPLQHRNKLFGYHEILADRGWHSGMDPLPLPGG